MTTQKYPFIVRGFNTFNTPGFTSQGKMSDLSTFTEKTVPNELAAIVELLRGKPFSTMSARNLLEIGSSINPFTVMSSSPLIYHVRSAEEAPELQSFELRLETDLTILDEVRDVREEVATILSLWAEKSRLRQRRGWRASAVRAIRWELNDNGVYVAHTKVLLGTAIFYNATSAHVQLEVELDHQNVVDDLVNLDRNLKPLLSNVKINCKHDRAGRFEL